jgi:predicted amidophosphoribosyltransferase
MVLAEGGPAMTTATEERCNRCGTKLRNNRQVCPCCGYELARPGANSSEQSASGPDEPAHLIKKVAAKAGVKICPICMASVNEADFVDHEGQQVCPTCDENLRKKAMRKAGMAPPPPPLNR